MIPPLELEASSFPYEEIKRVDSGLGHMLSPTLNSSLSAYCFSSYDDKASSTLKDTECLYSVLDIEILVLVN